MATWEVTLLYLILSILETQNRDRIVLYDVLLERHQAGTLTPEGQEWLTRLREEAEALMLRKAHAYALLQSRGHRLPTLEELHRIAPSWQKHVGAGLWLAGTRLGNEL